jgi:hypothetical protein
VGPTTYNGNITLRASPGGGATATFRGTGVDSAANLQIAMTDDPAGPAGGDYGSSADWAASAGNDFTVVYLRNTGQADALIANNPVPMTITGDADFSTPNSPRTTCPIETATGVPRTSIRFTNVRIAGGASCSFTLSAELRGVIPNPQWNSSFTIQGSPGGNVSGTFHHP